MADFIVDTAGNVTPDTFDSNAIVREFMVAFETSESLDLWSKLVTEEENELIEAMALDITDNTVATLANVLKEACDLLYVISGLVSVMEKHGLLMDVEVWGRKFDTLGDVITLFGEPVFEEAFRRVHASNMSKLGDDGKPVRREDGKVLKGPNYKPPVLTDLVTEVYVRSGGKPSYLIQH